MGLQHWHGLIATLGPEVLLIAVFFWLSPRLQSGGSSLRAIMVRELGQCSQLTHAKTHGFQPSELIQKNSPLVPGGPQPVITPINKLGGGFRYFYFHPYLGKISNLTNIFQKG